MSKGNIHYVITSSVTDDLVEHIYADNQEEAVRKFIQPDGNQYGYDEPDFDYEEIMITAFKNVRTFQIEPVESPPEPPRNIRKLNR